MNLFVVVTASLMLQFPPETPPPWWREAADKALDLTIEGKDLEVIAMWETRVAQHPKLREARMRLAAAHESRARSIRSGRTPGNAAEVSKHYQTAIAEMRRAIEEAGPAAPFDWIRGLIDIHHPVFGAGAADDYERLVRDAVKRYPADPYAHGYMIIMLAERNEPIDPAAAAARAAIPRTADARDAVAGFLAAHARDFGRLMPPAGRQAIVAAAASFVDEALKINPKHAGALRTKERIAQLRK